MSSKSSKGAHPVIGYLEASSAFLMGAFEHVRRRDPSAADGMQAALRAGAMLSLRLDLAPVTGFSKLIVDLTEADGKTFTLLQHELTQRVVQ